MRNKELKMKLGELQDEIMPVSADLCNNFKSIVLENNQRKFTLREVNFGRGAEISTALYQ